MSNFSHMIADHLECTRFVFSNLWSVDSMHFYFIDLHGLTLFTMYIRTIRENRVPFSIHFNLKINDGSMEMPWIQIIEFQNKPFLVSKLSIFSVHYTQSFPIKTSAECKRYATFLLGWFLELNYLVLNKTLIRAISFFKSHFAKPSFFSRLEGGMGLSGNLKNPLLINPLKNPLLT